MESFLGMHRCSDKPLHVRAPRGSSALTKLRRCPSVMGLQFSSLTEPFVLSNPKMPREMLKKYTQKNSGHDIPGVNSIFTKDRRDRL